MLGTRRAQYSNPAPDPASSPTTTPAVDVDDDPAPESTAHSCESVDASFLDVTSMEFTASAEKQTRDIGDLLTAQFLEDEREGGSTSD